MMQSIRVVIDEANQNAELFDETTGEKLVYSKFDFTMENSLEMDGLQIYLSIDDGPDVSANISQIICKTNRTTTN